VSGLATGARPAELPRDSSFLPDAARRFLAVGGFPGVYAVGETAALGGRRLALFCSVRCPGEIILQTYDLALALRSAGLTVVGGFHAPMERECLDLLLRGRQPVVVCPARSIDGMRLPGAWRTPLSEVRLLVLSPFAPEQRRVTARLAKDRNRFVAALADEVLVAYAAPGGRLEQLCREVVAQGKPSLTLASAANRHLVELGARAVTPESFGARGAAGADVAG